MIQWQIQLDSRRCKRPFAGIGLCGLLGALFAATGVKAHDAAAAQSVTPPSRRPLTPLQPPGEKSGNELVSLTMAADVVRIEPGRPFLLGFIFAIEPGWHIYWQNSGASGGPTEISVRTPAGFTVGQTLFPRPRAIVGEEGISYGYEDRTVLFVEITPPNSWVGPVNFTADASWMVCKDVCKLGSGKGQITLPFGSTSIPDASPTTVDPAVEEFKSRLPVPLSSVSGASAKFEGQELTIELPAGKYQEAEVFPNPSSGVTLGEARVEVRQSKMVAIVPIEIKPHNALGEPLRIAGLIGLGRGPDEPAYSFEIPLTNDGLPQPK